MAFNVQAGTLDDLLRDTYLRLVQDGERVSANRGRFREIVGATLELTNVRARLSRSESRRRVVSGVAELCWYLSGSNRGDLVVFYMPKYAAELEEDGTVHGGYGPRLFGHDQDAQVRNVIALLKESPTSRRAVVQIFDRSDQRVPRFKDVPCTCTMQFLLRDGQLHMVVSMRSNDAYVGLPHDVFAFTMLQEMVARSVNAEPGRYVHNAGSLHLYDSTEESMKVYLGEGYQSTTDGMPPMPLGDPWCRAEELVAAEVQIRAGVPYEQVSLPTDPYWADLARILAHHVARKAEDVEAMRRIARDMQDAILREFM
ncbi:thymidylate synthase [Nocardioides sediminis]|uniref:thymidylate synthase n=1 Tax=Nocardioides sediminis TaxID=433648 RepID=UPI000D3174A8|nr:thymidylate synthase [Nocardioides sediminis]